MEVYKIAKMYIKYIVYSPFLAASYEERSDPESLRMERTEKDHTLFEDRESELRTMDNKVTGED